MTDKNTGLPVAGATVEIQCSNHLTATTDSNGVYTYIYGIAPNIFYSVEAYAPFYAYNKISAPPGGIPVPDGSTYTQNVEIRPGGSASGRITDVFTGNPILAPYAGGGVKVTVDEIIYLVGTNVNANGEYDSMSNEDKHKYGPGISGYAANCSGLYVITEDVQTGLTILPGQNNVFDFAVKAFGVVALTIKDSITNLIIPNCTVQFSTTDVEDNPIVLTEPDGFSGQQIPKVRQGNHTLIITASGYSDTAVISTVSQQNNPFTLLLTTSPVAPAIPTITPNGGTFSDSVTVTISNVDSGCVAYYTTDGTNPTTDSPMYTEPFELSTSATVVTAVYDATNYLWSEFVSASFVVYKAPLLLTEELKSANPLIKFIVSKVENVPYFGPKLHCRVESFADEAMTILLDDRLSNIVGSAHPSFEYSFNNDTWFDVAPTGIDPTQYSNFDMYIRARVFVGPRQQAYVRCSVGIDS